ncbi:MAG: PTS sugar transporter subunit IIA [Pseudomonadales bacterium]
MNIESILVPERVVAGLVAGSKKRAIELASQHIVAQLPQLNAGKVYRGLIAREKLGTTALGKGVAIPHCRLDDCTTTIGGLFTLTDGVDFSAADDLPVNIMFVLLAPVDANEARANKEHLETLAMLAKNLDKEAYRQALLQADSNDGLYQAALSSLADIA